MFKGMISRVLFVGLMAVSVTSNATILVNHHNQPYREYTHVISQSKHVSKVSHARSSHHNAHSSYHRSYAQHSKVVDSCLRMKNGHRYRVC